MAVHSKNPSFAELQREKIASSVQNSFDSMGVVHQAEKEIPAHTPVMPVKAEEKRETKEEPAVIKTVTPESGEKKRKDVLIGIHVTEDERNELRKLFCSNGFSLATAYRAAMSYLRQDIELGKAYITNNGEIFRK